MTELSTERGLGKVEGQLGTLTTLLRDHISASNEGRGKLHSRIDAVGRRVDTHVKEIGNKVDAIDGRVTQLEADVGILKPIVEDYSRLKAKGKIYWGLFVVILSLIGIVAAGVINWWINWGLSYLIPPSS